MQALGSVGMINHKLLGASDTAKLASLFNSIHSKHTVNFGPARGPCQANVAKIPLGLSTKKKIRLFIFVHKNV
jgi:hypothetical protein